MFKLPPSQGFSFHNFSPSNSLFVCALGRSLLIEIFSKKVCPRRRPTKDTHTKEEPYYLGEGADQRHHGEEHVVPFRAAGVQFLHLDQICKAHSDLHLPGRPHIPLSFMKTLIKLTISNLSEIHHRDVMQLRV